MISEKNLTFDNKYVKKEEEKLDARGLPDKTLKVVGELRIPYMYGKKQVSCHYKYLLIVDI